MGLLHKTSTYLVGSMQYRDGSEWRSQVERELCPLGIKVHNPYKKMFMFAPKEDKEQHLIYKRMMEEERYDEISDIFKQIISYDLNSVDRSDFIIAQVIPGVASWGSAHELVNAQELKKPTFVFVEGGKKLCPYWLMGLIPHKYIFSSLDEVLSIIKKIDSGEIIADSSRWRLLREEYR